MRIIRALRLSSRSLRRLMDRASRRSTASEAPLLGLRPSEKMRTPALITAHGAPDASSLIIAQPMEVVPKSKPSRYLILPRIALLPSLFPLYIRP